MIIFPVHPTNQGQGILKNKREHSPSLGTFPKNFKTTQDIEMICFYFDFASLKVILYILIVFIVLRYSPCKLLILIGEGGRDKPTDFGLRRARSSWEAEKNGPPT